MTCVWKEYEIKTKMVQAQCLHLKFDGPMMEEVSLETVSLNIIKHICSWRDKFIILQTLNRQAKIYTIYICDTTL